MPVLGSQVCETVVLEDNRSFAGRVVSRIDRRCDFGQARSGKHAIDRGRRRSVVSGARPDSTSIMLVRHVEKVLSMRME